MYQDRSNDLDPRVSNVLNEAPKILKALEVTQDMLEKFYVIKNNDRDVIVRFGHFSEPDDYNRVFEELNPDEYGNKFYFYGENWDYPKEYKESLLKLNESCLEAYITFLEAEREALIKRWNGMAKEIKPKKK